MKRTLLLAGTGIAVAAGVAMASTTGTGHGIAVADKAANQSYHAVARDATLHGMPQGSVLLGRAADGTLDVHVMISGLTPGSMHSVRLAKANGSPAITYFDNLTANGGGSADVILHSIDANVSLPANARLEILAGRSGQFGNNQGTPLARLVIAHSATLPRYSAVPRGGIRSRLIANDLTADGVSEGTLTGSAHIAYDPNSNGGTVTVTVRATGLTPGQHAAHIHSGSCAQQGGVVTMLPDLTADDQGMIDQTVTVTNVRLALKSFPATGMYLNIHQGAMDQILANNAPTLSFRPLLCGNI